MSRPRPFFLLGFAALSGLWPSVLLAQTTITLSNGQTDSTTYNTTGNNLTLSVANTHTGTLSGAISGSGGVTKVGLGTASLSGVKTYTGPTTVSGGTLQIAGSLDAASVISVGAGATAVLSMTGAHGNTIANAGTLDFRRSSVVTYSGAISGSGSLVQSGVGTVALTGKNTSTGSVTVSAGRLEFRNDDAVPVLASSFTVASGATLQVGTTTLSSIGTNFTTNGEVLFLSSGTLAVNGAIAGSGSVHLIGTGTVRFAQDASYAGSTVIYGGTLQVDGALSSSTELDVRSGSGLRFRAGSYINTISNAGSLQTAESSAITGNLTLGGVISGAGTLHHNGSGTVTLSGANTYTGSTTISGGTLWLTGSLNASSAISVAAGTTLAIASTSSFGNTIVNDGTLSKVTSAGTTTLSGAISGSGSFIHSGSGMTVLSGNNSYTGATTISGGTLRIAGALSASSAITVAAGATLDLKSSASLSNTIANDGTIDITRTAGTMTLSGAISGSGGLRHSSPGTTILMGRNQSTGEVVVSAGRLELNGDDSIPAASHFTVAEGATLRLQPAYSTGYSKSFTTNGTLIFAPSNSWDLYGSIDGSGGFTQAGSGITSFNRDVSYTGPTLVSAGTLQITRGLSASTTITIASGARLRFSSGSYGNTITNAGTLMTATPFSSSTERLTLSGVISGTGALQHNGLGTVTLSGANTYTGNTTISSGTLWLAGSLDASSAVTVASGATLGIAPAAASVANAITNQGRVSSATSTGTTTTLSGAIGGSGAFVHSGAGTTILSGVNTYSGNTTISGGTLQLNGSLSASTAIAIASGATLALNSGAPFGSTITNDGTIDITRSTGTTTLSSAISGGGTLRHSGAATTILTGNNQSTGEVVVTAGRLELIGDNAIARASHYTVGADATLRLQPQTSTGFSLNFTTNGALIFAPGGTWDLYGSIDGSGGFTQSGSGTTRFMRDVSYSGLTTVNGGTLQIGAGLSASTTFTVASGARLRFSDGKYGNTITNAGTLYTAGSFSLSRDRLTLSGAISGTGGVQHDGLGLATLSGANTYTGTTTISSGTLSFAGPASLYSGTPANWTADKLVVASGATAAFNVGGAGEFTASHIDTLKVLGSASGGFRNGASLALDTTNATGGVFTYSGDIANPNGGANALGLVKLGAGALVLTGTHTYTGPTSVNAGSLVLNGSATSSAFTVNNGATLSGGGTSGALTIASGGTLSPGNSPGTFSAGNTVFAGGGTLLWEIADAAGAAGAGWDLLNISGTLAIGATSGSRFTIDLASLLGGTSPGAAANFNPALNYSFDFVTASGGITGFNTNVFTLDTTGLQNALNGLWSIAQNGNVLSLVYTTNAIPEPGAYAALAGLVAFALTMRRWQKRRRL